MFCDPVVFGHELEEAEPENGIRNVHFPAIQ